MVGTVLENQAPLRDGEHSELSDFTTLMISCGDDRLSVIVAAPQVDGLEPLYAIEQREVTLRFDSEVPKGELVESGLGRTRRLLVRAEREGIQWTARFDLPPASGADGSGNRRFMASDDSGARGIPRSNPTQEGR